MNQLTQSKDWPHVFVDAQLSNGRSAQIIPLTFGRARITLVSQQNDQCFDDLW